MFLDDSERASFAARLGRTLRAPPRAPSRDAQRATLHVASALTGNMPGWAASITAGHVSPSRHRVRTRFAPASDLTLQRFTGVRGASALGALGAEWWCSELTSVLDAIELTIRHAHAAGISHAAVPYAVALNFLRREANPWTATSPILPSTCARVVAEGRAALTALNRELARRGAETVPAPPVAPKEPPKGPGVLETVESISSTTRWLVGGVVAVTAAIVGWKVYKEIKG